MTICQDCGLEVLKFCKRGLKDGRGDIVSEYPVLLHPGLCCDCYSQMNGMPEDMRRRPRRK